MRVHVVHAHNRNLYLDDIEAMHRHRHQVFAEQRGWKALQSPDGLDIDEFDTDAATYLIAIAPDGAVVGSSRLIPSWRPTMIKLLFPEYCAGEVPVGPGIWEWTRHATPGLGFTKAYNIEVQIVLNLAVLEFARLRGIESFIGILECALLPYTVELGWNSMPMGPPRRYGEGQAVAVHSAVKPGHLEALRKKVGVSEAVLVEAPGFAGARGRAARRLLEQVSSAGEAELARLAAPLAREA